MSDTTSLFIACCIPLLCIVLIGGGVAYWLISRKKAKEKAVLSATDTTAKAEPSSTDAPARKTISIDTPGSVGAVSQEVGYDVRDLMMMGFTQKEISSFSKEDIMSVVDGKRKLQELRNKKNPPAQKMSYPQAQVTLGKEISISPVKPTLSEQQIKTLVQGLWATEDPNEGDFRNAMRFAGKYRKECETKLRQLGKDAIPYLEPYADRKEIAPLLADLKKL